MDAHTRAKTPLALANDEFACIVKNEDTESDFGVHFMLYR
jgi:hypothetical protein